MLDTCGMSYCGQCEAHKTPDAFNKSSKTPTGLDTFCKECRKKNRKEYYKNNKDIFRNIYLKHKFGITLETYNKMLKDQGGCCAICRKKETKISFAVDHSHKSGRIRGLLCTNCNSGLESFDEDLQRMRRALEYLETFGGNRGIQENHQSSN